jgi:hypothetical protein
MTTIRNLIALRLMLWALRLVARRDDARSLRIAIPLTLAMAETMQGVSAKALEPHADALRQRLGELRDKLARLEGSETVPA